MTEAPPRETRVLRRSGEGRIFGGVCAGLGRFTGIDPVVFRVGFAVLLLGSGVGFILYVAAVLLMKDPRGGPGIIEQWTRRDFDAEAVLALLTAVLAFGLGLNLATVWLGTGTVVVGVLLVVALLAAHANGVDLLGLARSMPERLNRRQTTSPTSVPAAPPYGESGYAQGGYPQGGYTERGYAEGASPETRAYASPPQAPPSHQDAPEAPVPTSFAADPAHTDTGHDAAGHAAAGRDDTTSADPAAEQPADGSSDTGRTTPHEEADRATPSEGTDHTTSHEGTGRAVPYLGAGVTRVDATLPQEPATDAHDDASSQGGAYGGPRREAAREGAAGVQGAVHRVARLRGAVRPPWPLPAAGPA
ncbi:PspC domain-containing protein [Nonomuraea sp. NBC_01738]|uniref:PspC domain-containing protein n=1 Tax=Nonomuraea sp. NBC_01738 TaxID=2976003 RepID=UPI002E15F990|nr:PspC domain-containing protein [Nonomuraea sp. NBC_01738]